MSNRKLRHFYCWSHLPRKFPVCPRMEVSEEEGKPALIFPDKYRANRQSKTSLEKEANNLLKKQGRLQYCGEKNCWEIHDAYDKPIPCIVVNVLSFSLERPTYLVGSN